MKIQTFQTTKNIYLVIENGNGIIHKAFQKYLDALKYIEYLKKENGLDCYEIFPIHYQFYQF